MAMTPAPAPAAAAAIQVAASSYDLAYSVRNIQQLLNQLGYDAGTPDGSMGFKTHNAIRAFEKDAQLPITGEASASLFQRLQQATAEEQGGQTSAVGRSTATGDVPLRSADVQQLEKDLKVLGYNPGSADGVYDHKTRTAIQRYQQDHAMTVDGLATPSLLASLDSDVQGQVSGGGSGLSPARTVRLQQALGAQGYYQGGPTGIYDQDTRDAVRDYQRASGLSVTGVADNNLLARLESGSSYGTYGAASPTVIKQIEQSLSDKGYRVGPIDGRMDTQTQTAIDDFLRQAQLSVSDQPSQQLLDTIRNSSMTAKEGSKKDLIDTGVNTITNLFSK